MIITLNNIIYLRRLDSAVGRDAMIAINMDYIVAYQQISVGRAASRNPIMEISMINGTVYTVGCSLEDFEEQYFIYIRSK